MTLRASQFARLVRARQTYVAADRALDLALDTDPCDRRCKCGHTHAAKVEAADAYASLRAEEASYAEFCTAFGRHGHY